MAVRHNVPNKWNISNVVPSIGGSQKSSGKSKPIANLSLEKLRENSPSERQRLISGGSISTPFSKNRSYSPRKLSRESSPLFRDSSPAVRNRRFSGDNHTNQSLKQKSISTRTLSSGNLTIVALKRQAYTQRSSSNLSLNTIDNDRPHAGRKFSDCSMAAPGIISMSDSGWRNSIGDLSERSRSSSTRRSSSAAKNGYRERSPASTRIINALTSSPKRERTRKKGVTHNSDFIEKSNNTNSFTIVSDIVKSIVLSQDIAPLKENNLSKGGVKESSITRITEMVVFTFIKMICIIIVIMMFDDIDS